MIEFLQTVIRAAWQLLGPIPMPWQSVIVVLLFILVFPWLLLRAIPWLITKISQLLLRVNFSQLLLNGAVILASILLFPEYLITRNLRQRGLKPPPIIYFLGDIVCGFVKIINQCKKLLDNCLQRGSKLQEYAFNKKWLFRRKWFIIVAMIIPFTWFVRPYMGKNSVTALIDRGVMWWYSLEGWVLNGKWTTSALTRPSPKQFIEDYFLAINRSQYSIAWNSLSPEYKSNKENSYSDFLKWWGTDVERVKIHGVSLKYEDTKSATVDIHLQFLMGKTKKLSKTEFIRYSLVWDSKNSRWLINAGDYLDK
jgi:hypothetical protein